jgi:hypothetical protein
VIRRSRADLPAPPSYAPVADLLRAMSPDPVSRVLDTTVAPFTRTAPYRGGAMSSDPSIIRRAAEVSTSGQPAESTETRPLRRSDVPVVPRSVSRQLDELVDLVVERIEQRVVDELERRGRRGVPGAY